MPRIYKNQAAWERQKGESAQAYEAFTTYLNMGTDRSLQAVAKRLSKSIPLIKRWSSAYNWVERCRAWDNELQREAKKQAVADLREMTKRHIDIAQQLQSLALQAVLEKGTEMVTSRNLASIIKMATELEKDSRDTDISVLSKEEAEVQQEEETEDVVVYVPDNGLGGGESG